MPFRLALLILTAALVAPLAAVSAAGSPQSAVASKTARLAEVPRTAAAYKAALDARSVDELKRRVGQDAAVKGTLDRIFVPKGDNLIVLNFDPNYRSAVTGVVYRQDFAAFPDLMPLVGTEVLLTGKITLYQGRPQIALRKPEQVKPVRK